jgi:glutathione peroxidase
MSAHDFAFTTIGGAPMPLADFQGKALLIVNTASQCGLTPQYAGLQALHTEFSPRGLVVIGVPANDFGAQEPGTEAEIAAFCTSRFAVSFPMTAKETVIGSAAHPFYRWVVAELGEAAAPRWNFHKYLIGRDGGILGTFGSRMEPRDPALVQAVEAALEA